MLKRLNISTHTVWEDVAGYSRAVRVGNLVCVSGTTATDEAGNLVGEGDVHAQAIYILQKIEKALQAAGASLSHVIRTRVYLTDITKWEEAATAHAEFFSEIRPANTLVEVSGLVSGGYLIEIEADALINEGL